MSQRQKRKQHWSFLPKIPIKQEMLRKAGLTRPMGTVELMLYGPGVTSNAQGDLQHEIAGVVDYLRSPMLTDAQLASMS